MILGRLPNDPLLDKEERVTRMEGFVSMIHRSMVVLVLALVGLVGCDYESRTVGDANPVRVAEMQKTLRDLWLGHIFLIQHVVLINAMNDSAERDAADIDVFSNGVNPYHLPKGTVRGLIAAHGAHHVLQINQYKNKDYAHLEETWPMMRQHVYVIADTLGTALAKQFPDKFS
jgi:hypothetical protein